MTDSTRPPTDDDHPKEASSSGANGPDRDGEERRGYGIGTVSRLTGISTHTLRVWERRYNAVEAERSESGRRLYSRRDIERLTVMKHLVDRGEPIGHVARLPQPELQERLQTYEQHVARREQLSSAPIRAALYGESLYADARGDIAGVNVVTREANLAAFRADIKRLRPEALVLEFPTIDSGTRGLVSDLRRLSAASRVVIIYSFGRRQDLDALTDEWTALLRAPVTGEELHRVLRATPAPSAPPAAATAVVPIAPEAKGEIPPRRYTRGQLAHMSNQSTTVECECPRHLVDLVVNLTAFEAYSADCESRSPADAALHAYLHETTARAREMIEQALHRVAVAEGIEEQVPVPGQAGR
jgi:DNA-binding transcriptional MerR regulator